VSWAREHGCPEGTQTKVTPSPETNAAYRSNALSHLHAYDVMTTPEVVLYKALGLCIVLGVALALVRETRFEMSV